MKKKRLFGQATSKEEALRNRARDLHADLFPEEYDSQNDSKSEAKDRKRGINPMANEYIATRDKYRVQLGFGPYEGRHTIDTEDTQEWVLGKLRAGKEENLIRTKIRRDKEIAEAARKREEERVQLQTPAWQRQKIDEMLASDTFLGFGNDRYDPHVMAFRVLGEIFRMDSPERSEARFRKQIRRVLPGKTETEYDELHRHALTKWTEAYGY